LELCHPDEAAGSPDQVALNARPAALIYAMSNAFGFGGVNTSIQLRKL